MESISFDRVAEIYDKTRRLPPKIMEKVVQKIANELKGWRKILDAGVGTRRFANLSLISRIWGYRHTWIFFTRKLLFVPSKR